MTKRTTTHPVHHAAKGIASTPKTSEGGFGDDQSDALIQALREYLSQNGDDSWQDDMPGLADKEMAEQDDE